MDDRVGDILAQRRALDRGAGTGVAISLLLHVGVTGLAVWAAMHQPLPQTASVLNIHFTPMPAVSQATRKAPPAPKPITEPKPVVAEPKPEVKPEPKSVPLSTFGKSTKRGSEHPAVAPKPTPAPPPAPAA